MSDQQECQQTLAHIAEAAKATGLDYKQARSLLIKFLELAGVPRKLQDATGKPLPQLFDTALRPHYD